MTREVYITIEAKAKEFAKLLKDAAVSAASAEYEVDMIMVQSMISALKAVGDELDSEKYGGILCDAAYRIDKEMGWM